ncbi:hypothetical protein QUF72_06805 [Desulfobacterales bacterium HSG2]|nr:hypothetical protein [Desulfobacterales bacterium HSG2]
MRRIYPSHPRNPLSYLIRKQWIPAFKINKLNRAGISEVSKSNSAGEAGMTWFCSEVSDPGRWRGNGTDPESGNPPPPGYRQKPVSFPLRRASPSC